MSHERLERKVTSILLGLIMVTGSVSFAIPGGIPDAYAIVQNEVYVAESGTSK